MNIESLTTSGEWVLSCAGCGSAITKGSMTRCTISSQMGMKRNVVRKDFAGSKLPWLSCWHPDGTVLVVDGEEVRDDGRA